MTEAGFIIVPGGWRLSRRHRGGSGFRPIMVAAWAPSCPRQS